MVFGSSANDHNPAWIYVNNALRSEETGYPRGIRRDTFFPGVHTCNFSEKMLTYYIDRLLGGTALGDPHQYYHS